MKWELYVHAATVRAAAMMTKPERFSAEDRAFMETPRMRAVLANDRAAYARAIAQERTTK